MPASDHKRRLTAFVVAMAVLIATPLAVVATDAFTDVPDSNVHHDNITWLADAGITSGCNPPDNDEYCPSDSVTRAQMATFMRNLATNQVVDAATAVEADHAATADSADSADTADNAANLGSESPDAVKSIAFGDTCGTDCPNNDDQMAQAEVEVPASGVVELNYSISASNDSGDELFVTTWASEGECETELIIIVPVPGNAIPGSLATSHVQDGDHVNLSGSTTVNVDAGTTSFSSCLIMVGAHDVQQGTVTGTWNPGSGGVGLASAGDVITFSEQETASFEENHGDSLEE